MEETDIKRTGSMWDLYKTFKYIDIHYSQKALILANNLKIYSKGKNYFAKIGINRFFFCMFKTEP